MTTPGEATGGGRGGGAARESMGFLTAACSQSTISQRSVNDQQRLPDHRTRRQRLVRLSRSLKGEDLADDRREAPGSRVSEGLSDQLCLLARSVLDLFNAPDVYAAASRLLLINPREAAGG